MAIGIGLIVVSLIGLYNGVKKNNKALIRSSVIALIVIAIIWIVCLYLYSLTPY